MYYEPKTTPSILASIPDCLRMILEDALEKSKVTRKSILISSNSLANRFILDRWDIRPSQRRRYRNLFSKIRKQCRQIFQYHLARGRIQWNDKSETYLFGVFKFDEVRGNLILGFVPISKEHEWTIGSR
ncbi:MAG: hypothetical protein BAJATHORv1_20433 [Candidatus Thorarchaeota archaeon]|nr:MAG: hypothetical protein BAJATHORv1_20433 [Candidatus Thorarchaeota archaeon]